MAGSGISGVRNCICRNRGDAARRPSHPFRIFAGPPDSISHPPDSHPPHAPRCIFLHLPPFFFHEIFFVNYYRIFVFMFIERLQCRNVTLSQNPALMCYIGFFFWGCNSSVVRHGNCSRRYSAKSDYMDHRLGDPFRSWNNGSYRSLLHSRSFLAVCYCHNWVCFICYFHPRITYRNIPDKRRHAITLYFARRARGRVLR